MTDADAPFNQRSGRLWSGLTPPRTGAWRRRTAQTFQHDGTRTGRRANSADAAGRRRRWWTHTLD